MSTTTFYSDYMVMLALLHILERACIVWMWT